MSSWGESLGFGSVIVTHRYLAEYAFWKISIFWYVLTLAHSFVTMCKAMKRRGRGLEVKKAKQNFFSQRLVFNVVPSVLVWQQMIFIRWEICQGQNLGSVSTSHVSRHQQWHMVGRYLKWRVSTTTLYSIQTLQSNRSRTRHWKCTWLSSAFLGGPAMLRHLQFYIKELGLRLRPLKAVLRASALPTTASVLTKAYLIEVCVKCGASVVRQSFEWTKLVVCLYGIFKNLFPISSNQYPL